jgi:hypothetical protein
MIHITETVSFDEGEIEERAVRAKGPGGQNARMEARAVEVRLDLVKSALPSDVKQRLRAAAPAHDDQWSPGRGRPCRPFAGAQPCRGAHSAVRAPPICGESAGEPHADGGQPPGAQGENGIEGTAIRGQALTSKDGRRLASDIGARRRRTGCDDGGISSNWARRVVARRRARVRAARLEYLRNCRELVWSASRRSVRSGDIWGARRWAAPHCG